jgi:predicted RNA-binding protein YlxR (DUF448 family)
LVRLALREPAAAGRAALAVDRSQTMPGRGAYVCDRDCLRRAVARRRLPRAFRRAVAIDAQTVESLD